MLNDQLTNYALEEPDPNASTIEVVQATLNVPSELELVVVSGGPVFLFMGSRNKQDCYDGSHAPSPTFTLCAAVGMIAKCFMPSAIGQITIASDTSSIGYIRQVECA